MIKKFPKGSEWRKWDLHVHSPASYYWIDGPKFIDATKAESEAQLKKMYETIEASDVSVFAITDYWTFDGYLRFKKYIKDNDLSLSKSVFPGMELRVEAPVDYRLNVQVILSDELTEQQLTDFKSEIRINSIDRPLSDDAITQFARTLDDSKAKKHGFKPVGSLSDKEVFELGAKTVEVDKNSLFKKAMKTLPPNKGYILMPFDTNDGLSRLKCVNHPQSANDFMRNSHIFETRDKESKDLFLGIETESNKTFVKDFQKAIGGLPKPVVCGSDAHKFSDYGKYPSNKCTWIKADSNFRGFSQIIEEPEDRVCIGDKPEKLKQIELNSTKYISGLRVKRNPSSRDGWFDCDIEINSGLVAVIGKKGSGKSAFADIIALAGRSHVNPQNYSFLNENKFRKDKSESKKYEAVLEWCGGEPSTISLDSEVDVSTENERVKYLPQKYVEQICNVDGVSDVFQNEINSVIFKYVPDSEREGTISLSELKEKRTGDIDQSIRKKRVAIEDINNKICALEDKNTIDYKTKIENKLTDKKSALFSLVSPKEIKEPKDELPEIDKNRLLQLEEKKRKIEEQIEAVNKEKSKLNGSLSFLNSFETKARESIGHVETLISEYKSQARELGVDLNKIISISFSKTIIQLKREELLKRLDEIEVLLGDKKPESPKNLYTVQKSINEGIENISKTFKDERKMYQDYLKAKSRFEQEQLLIKGKSDDSSLETVASLESHIKYLDTELVKALELEKKKRVVLVKDLFNEISKKILEFEKIYNPLITFIKNDNRDTQLTFNASVNLDKHGFAEDFLSKINQSREGSFQGIDEGLKRLKGIMQNHSFCTDKEIVMFVDAVTYCLEKDVKYDKKTDVRKQLNSKFTIKDIYDYLYKLEYLDVEFNVLFNGKDLNTNEFSPGEKGALLLIFYLLIDKSDVPLIIDQPEDNLDNESVYSVLVPHIRDVKRRRQIIIVTHNPNLAVVCDAEQIIYVEMNKRKNIINYESGSIEDTTINSKVVDILEGTMPAFTKRDNKYFKK